MHGPTLIVTRPAREAARWVEALRAAGVRAESFPLIAIEALHDALGLEAARRALPRFAAVMFVSAAAVEHFVDAPGVSAWLATRRCWATGPGTARALQDAGVPPGGIDLPDAAAPQFDSEQLWLRVRDQVAADTRVLFVRGGNAQGEATGRDWLAQQVQAAGGGVETVVAYRRLAPDFDDAARARIAAWAMPPSAGASARAIWCFSSAEAIGNLLRATPGTDWRSAAALCTHPRIAQAARAGGFGRVHTGGPALTDIVASIESLG